MQRGWDSPKVFPSLPIEKVKSEPNTGGGLPWSTSMRNDADEQTGLPPGTRTQKKTRNSGGRSPTDIEEVSSIVEQFFRNEDVLAVREEARILHRFSEEI